MNQHTYQIITPKGNGGIATIALQGDGIEDSLIKIFAPFNKKKKNALPQAGVFKYGKIMSQQDETLDEVLLAKISSTHFELHTHGGIFSLRKIIQELDANGFQSLASNHQIKTATTDYNLILSDISNVREYHFISDQAEKHLETFIKKSPPSPEEIISLFKTMITHWQKELKQRKRIKICLAGLPNAGKSSLINRITGKDRALVSHLERTTRDTITENFQTKGYRFQIIDTAGIHEPDNLLDEKSVELTYENIRSSELIIWLHSSENDFQEKEIDYLKKIKAFVNKSIPICLAFTKSDLEVSTTPPPFPFDTTYHISNQTGEGIEELLDYIVQVSFPSSDLSSIPSALSNKMVEELEHLIHAVDLKKPHHKILTDYFDQLKHLTTQMNKKEIQ